MPTKLKAKAPATKMVFCDNCKGTVQGVVQGGYVHQPDHLPGPIRISLIKCPLCYFPVLTEEEHDGMAQWDKPMTLYPTPRVLGYAVPPGIRKAYEDAAKCLATGLYTPCVIMCRKVLDGICSHSLSKTKRRTLDAGLKEMQSLGQIDKNLYQWSTQVRVSGNEAVHDVTADFDQTDAEDLMAFAEAVAEYVFTYKHRFDEFEKRQAARTAKTSKSATP